LNKHHVPAARISKWDYNGDGLAAIYIIFGKDLCDLVSYFFSTWEAACEV
jgi:hypothetical protein